MKQKGRTAQPWTEEQLKAVREYLEGDESCAEVAARYDVPATTFKYWVKKFRRQEQKAVKLTE